MSSRSARVILTQTALDDIREILSYTEEEWGPAQRDIYMRQIQAVIDRLALMPSMGRAQDGIHPGLRGIPVGRHLLYYTYTDNVVYVRHIWHGRRNPQAIDWDATDAESGNTPDV